MVVYTLFKIAQLSTVDLSAVIVASIPKSKTFRVKTTLLPSVLARVILLAEGDRLGLNASWLRPEMANSDF
ncbi:MAG: hypothetical protein NZ899_05520 [Thermoguttaceae bacterium]|nr:hypothetical protein [Thermoguttaceae bacterium]MDW8078225.1 hypothetical protein [Thermoguttaceae bacterium]